MIGAFAPVPDLIRSATGHVLEIGSGSGTFWQYFNTSKITHLYATEPVIDLHQALQSSAESLGLESKLTILACGGEGKTLLPALTKIGVSQQESFDTIISLRSLCTIPDLETSIQTHYKLLKPGGRYIICEHVINPWRTKNGSIMARVSQVVWGLLGWTYFVGGCELSRDTIGILDRVGEWEKIEIRRDMSWAVLPFVTGVYTKPSY
jgi:SAM-dependent methyltransferase